MDDDRVFIVAFPARRVFTAEKDRARQYDEHARLTDGADDKQRSSKVGDMIGEPVFERVANLLNIRLPDGLFELRSRLIADSGKEMNEKLWTQQRGFTFSEYSHTVQIPC